ncbi:hypothetical protein E2562_022096 [Oryza meyeriana var. granulata]|uniref:Uncharacterized protein n=1 Tax=Oryza meyeriana var. granulata TaxID=110450 RepID=A0A6G1ENS2_9ORYZ|nr:hypothetical protein E2562_022096 [Oryza meyeriana var. granulata]
MTNATGLACQNTFPEEEILFLLYLLMEEERDWSAAVELGDGRRRSHGGLHGSRQGGKIEGTTWLHKVSHCREYIKKNEVVLGASESINKFDWDNKHDGINILISKASAAPNPNLLVGTVVGRPSDATDVFPDACVMFQQSKPTTYINAATHGSSLSLTPG